MILNKCEVSPQFWDNFNEYSAQTTSPSFNNSSSIIDGKSANITQILADTMSVGAESQLFNNSGEFTHFLEQDNNSQASRRSSRNFGQSEEYYRSEILYLKQRLAR